MRILALIDSLDPPAGAERAAAAVAIGLARRGHEITVCETRSRGALLGDQIEAAGVNRFSLDRRGRLDVAPFRRLTSFAREWRPDVLHAHMFGSNVWASMLARRDLARVFVAHEHGTTFDGAGGLVMRWLNRLLIAPPADAMVAGTHAEARRMIERGGVPEGKLVTIPAPYVAREAAPTADLRGELGLAPDIPLVGVIAWLRPEKALEVVIDGFAQVVVPRVPNAHLVLAGDGPCRAELEARAQAAGLADRIHFLGAREDVATVLEAIDVGTSSSDRESTSMFALECIAHGVPMVATRVGGAAEILEDGVSGRLVPTRDPQALGSAIADLLSDPAMRKAYATRASLATEQFEPERVVDLFVGLYEGLLGR